MGTDSGVPLTGRRAPVTTHGDPPVELERSGKPATADRVDLLPGLPPMKRPSTSQETAARFRASYARRMSRVLGVPMTGEIQRDAPHLREIVLRHIGSDSIMPRAIFAIARASYGDATDRRLWRALRVLRAEGKIQWTGSGYVRSSP